MTDTLDADVKNLFGDLPEEEAAPIEQEPAQPQAQEPEPQPAPDPTPVEVQPETIQQPEQPKEAHHVPLAVLLDEREKRKEAEKDAAALRAWRAEQEAKAQSQQAIPDPYEDPQGYDRYVQTQLQQQQFNLRTEMSGRFAEQKYGKETVEKAIAWAQEQGRIDPFLGQRVQASQSPVEFVVEQFNREQFFKQYGSDPSALQALMTTQPTAAPQPTPVNPAPRPQAPPRSLAAAPNAGGSQAEMPAGSIMDSIPLNLG